MLRVGDKIVLKKKMGAFTNIDEVCEVIAIEDHTISFKFGNGMHIGCMSEDELDKYFDVLNEAQQTTVTEDTINDILFRSKISVKTIYDKCTLMTVKLPNGFVLTASSGSVTPENYSEIIGRDTCLSKIRDELWKLEGYHLQQKLYEEAYKKESSHPVDW